MSAFWTDRGKLEVVPGSDIKKAIQEGVDLAAIGDRRFEFKFNGVVVRVAADSDPALIYRDWQRAIRGYTSGPVGPHPAAELTPEEVASDARIAAETEARRQAASAEYEAKAAAARAAIEAELAGTPDIEVEPDKAEEYAAYKAMNSEDGYSAGVVTYAERWARLMQVRMAAGADLEAIAKAASHDADTDGITGFMYGCAAQALAHFWRHGERLRRWHNIDAQIKDEGEKANESGGVLNPAVLSIG